MKQDFSSMLNYLILVVILSLGDAHAKNDASKLIKEGTLVKVKYPIAVARYTKSVRMWVLNATKHQIKYFEFHANRISQNKKQIPQLPSGSKSINEADCVFTGKSLKGVVLQLTKDCKYINKSNNRIGELSRPKITPKSSSRFKDNFRSDPIPDTDYDFTTLNRNLEFGIHYLEDFNKNPFDGKHPYLGAQLPLPFTTNIGVAYGTEAYRKIKGFVGSDENTVKFLDEFFALTFQNVKFVLAELKGLDANFYPVMYFTNDEETSASKTFQCYHVDPKTQFCLLAYYKQAILEQWKMKSTVDTFVFMSEKYRYTPGMASHACACNVRNIPCMAVVHPDIVSPSDLGFQENIEKASFLAAHQLGHTFGMYHDYDKEMNSWLSNDTKCGPSDNAGYFIMSPSYSETGWGRKGWLFKMMEGGLGFWSACSKNAFNAFLKWLIEGIPDKMEYCLYPYYPFDNRSFSDYGTTTYVS